MTASHREIGCAPSEEFCRKRHRPLFILLAVTLTVVSLGVVITGVGTKWQCDIGKQAQVDATEARRQAEEAGKAVAVEAESRKALDKSIEKIERSIDKMSVREEQISSGLDKLIGMHEKLGGREP